MAKVITSATFDLFHEGHYNILKRAKEQAKQSWDDAHMSPAERTAKVRAEQQQAIQAANERIDAAEQKLAELK